MPCKFESKWSGSLVFARRILHLQPYKGPEKAKKREKQQIFEITP